MISRIVLSLKLIDWNNRNPEKLSVNKQNANKEHGIDEMAACVLNYFRQ